MHPGRDRKIEIWNGLLDSSKGGKRLIVSSTLYTATVDDSYDSIVVKLYIHKYIHCKSMILPWSDSVRFPSIGRKPSCFSGGNVMHMPQSSTTNLLVLASPRLVPRVWHVGKIPCFTVSHNFEVWSLCKILQLSHPGWCTIKKHMYTAWANSMQRFHTKPLVLTKQQGTQSMCETQGLFPKQRKIESTSINACYRTRKHKQSQHLHEKRMHEHVRLRRCA